MEITGDNREVEGIGTALDKVQSLSLLQDAQKKRQEREHTLFLDVPSWNGDLVAEYRVVPPNELKKVAERAMQRARQNNGDSEPAANDVAMIAAACVCLYMKDPESGERVPLEDEHGHVGYNRVAKLLGKADELKSTSQTIRYLMAERGDEDGQWVENVMAMSLHANAIGRWTKDPSRHGVDLEELLGEL